MMALFTLMSPGGSPGVTTTALAMTYGWGGRVLLAECDPKGGDVLAGFLGGRLAGAHGGLLELALAIARGTDPAALWNNLISLDAGVRDWLLLPGLADPREAAQMADAWHDIAKTLAAADTMDVVIDIGRVGGADTPMALLYASDLAVMVLRPTLRQVTAAKPRLDWLARHLGADMPVALCLVGDGDYLSGHISDVLFDLPILGVLPNDPASAAVLSDGMAAGRFRRLPPLLRAASGLAISLRSYLTEGQVAAERGTA